ncbi:MAG: Asp-tRNA(Asn)/Glu-tRNA(Gln) amidotransferase subunit GatA [Clostridiales bacterium]|jgi:aspartyl-tRNA(Asn)/glutamyl-tRNA(Gln) amidotransferase subunit A|nr:Asp-tRNA(Asn)/Glu-tRNA(Gln) amidotransferase subunit GatA [Clostridiales bacterium]
METIMKEVTRMSALTLARKIKNRELSVEEVTEAQLQVIKEREPIYNSYITITENEAKEQAKAVQRQIDDGEFKNSPLAGVPVAIKDNICTKGVKTTCASKMLADFIPSYNATVTERLRDAGAILIGKVNLDEFAMGGTTKTSYFGPSKNPWNPDYTPGGSSGGSSAAVAAEEAFVSLGSDTGGSIRQPAAYCGLVGFKPTYGTVSRYGLIPLASSLDQIGPLGRNISDCVSVLEAISGYDPKDSTVVKQEKYAYSQALVDDVSNMRIGIPKLYLDEDLNEDIRSCFMGALKTFEDMGAKLEIFDINEIMYSLQAYYVISCAEASSNLSRYDGVRYGHRTADYDSLDELYKNSRGEGFGYEVKRRIMLGAYMISSGNYETYYNKARRIRSAISRAYEKAFDKYDVLLSPESLNTAPLLSSDSSQTHKKHKSEMLNCSVNLAGLPAVSIPCGKDRKGLPIGLQLIGNKFGEKNIIQAAYSFEQTKPYERPKVR